MTDKIIVNFTPTGMVPTRAMTPHVPITPDEIIEQVHEAYELGITVVHLHARDQHEVPTWDPKIYQRIFEGVRKHCPDLVIGASTSGRNFPEFEKRSAVIELRPDLCSLTLSSLNFVTQASPNSPEMIRGLAQKMKDHGVKPEFECFDLGMINYGLYLIRKGLAEPPFYWNLFFGNIAGMQSSLAQIGVALSEIRGPEHYVALGGIGRSQLAVNATAIAHGYGIRTGLEDNIWFDSEETVKARNIDLLKRVHALMDLNGKKLLTTAEFGRLGFYNGR
jgi:uncharacterized protein (DUF849 family)